MTRKYFGTDGIRGKVALRPSRQTSSFAWATPPAWCSRAPTWRLRTATAPPSSSARTRASPATCSRPHSSRGFRPPASTPSSSGPCPRRAWRSSPARSGLGGHHGLRLAQSLRGQRHQVLLRRGREAAGCGRARDRGRAGRAARHARIPRSSARPSACTTPKGATSSSARARSPSTGRCAASSSWSTARTARAIASAPAFSRSWAPRWSPSARTPTARTSTTAAAPRTLDPGQGRGGTRRGLRHRLRRRRRSPRHGRPRRAALRRRPAPVRGSPSTVTRSAACAAAWRERS